MASRGRQALTLDHVHAQLGGARLVAQREVHRAAHLHRARLSLPRQAQLAAAQLRTTVEVRGTVQAGGAREGPGRGKDGSSPPPVSRVPRPSPSPLTVEELRLDTEELLLSMRSSEGPSPGASSPFSRI